MALEPLERKKLKSDMLIAWLTLIGLTVGGGFALIQFLDAKAKRQVDHSLQVSNRVWEQPIAGYRATVDKVLWKAYPDVEKLLTSQTKSDAEVATEYKKLIVGAIEGNDEARLAFTSIVDYFDGVAVCVSAQLCDASVVQALLGRNGQTFFRQVAPYICHLRKQWNDPMIASSMESYFNPGAVGKACIGYE